MQGINTFWEAVSLSVRLSEVIETMQSQVTDQSCCFGWSRARAAISCERLSSVPVALLWREEEPLGSIECTANLLRLPS